MPENNKLEPVKRLVSKKFNQEAKNFELVDNLEAINVSLLDAPTLEKLSEFIPEYVLATWSDYPTEFTKNLTETKRLQIVNDTFHFKFLPTALETISLTFRIDGLSYIDITHLLRHRTGSFSAQCTADRFLQSDVHCVPSSIRNSKYFEEYLDLTTKCKELYSKMIKDKEITIMDARYILPRNSVSFYYVRFNIKDALGFIKQRIDRQIQPMSDNVLAYKMFTEILKVYPCMYDLVDIDEAPQHYMKTTMSPYSTGLYQPEEKWDTFEYNKEDFLYGRRQWTKEFKEIYEETKNCIENAKKEWENIINE